VQGHWQNKLSKQVRHRTLATQRIPYTRMGTSRRRKPQMTKSSRSCCIPAELWLPRSRVSQSGLDCWCISYAHYVTVVSRDCAPYCAHGNSKGFMPLQRLLCPKPNMLPSTAPNPWQRWQPKLQLGSSLQWSCCAWSALLEDMLPQAKWSTKPLSQPT